MYLGISHWGLLHFLCSDPVSECSGQEKTEVMLTGRAAALDRINGVQLPLKDFVKSLILAGSWLPTGENLKSCFAASPTCFAGS